MQDLRSIARELYAGAPERFIAERDMRAKGLRATGDRRLAAAVRALPKPSIAAWAVGLLARESPDFHAVLELGRTLRQAQEDLDPDALRTLGRRRRQLVSAMAKEAGTLAEHYDRRLGPSALSEVEQTIQAALADPDAAVAVTSGRLVRSLSAEGLDAADLAGALGGEGVREEDAPEGRDASDPAHEPNTESGLPRAPGGATLTVIAEARAEKTRREAQRLERDRREREFREAALLEAEAAATTATERHARAIRRMADAAADQARLENDIAALRDRLGRLQTELETSTMERRSIEDDLTTAAQEKERASRDVDEARGRVRRLT